MAFSSKRCGKYVTLRCVLDSCDSGSTTNMVQISVTHWNTVIIIQRNISHFGQAENEKTPLFQHPLQCEIDCKATTVTSELILKDKCNNDELDDITQHMVNGFKEKYHKRVEEFLSLEDVKNKFEVWKSGTSVSPMSGLHLGIWKILFVDHMCLNEKQPNGLPGPNEIKCDAIQNKLQTMWFNLLNYATKWEHRL